MLPSHRISQISEEARITLNEIKGCVQVKVTQKIVIKAATPVF